MHFLLLFLSNKQRKAVRMANNLNMIMQNILNSNPQAKQLYDNLKGKSPEELKQYAMNVAQSRGINLQQFLGNYGIRI